MAVDECFVRVGIEFRIERPVQPGYQGVDIIV